MSTPATTTASTTSSVSASASAAIPTVAAPAKAATKRAATQLSASTDAVTLAKAFVAKYDAAVVAYLISQKSRVYNDVPALVKPFVSAEWSTLVALINYATPVIAEAFFAALEDSIGNAPTELLTGLVEDIVGAVTAPAPVVVTAPIVDAPIAPVPWYRVAPAPPVGGV